MIWLEEITNRKLLSRIYYRYEKAFPKAERRDKEDFLNLLDCADVAIFSVKTEITEVGYVVVWDLEGFTFIEHLEIYPEYRNSGLGVKVLNWLKSRHTGLVLESEPGDLNDISSRRIGFYKRNDFIIKSKNYLQPSYHLGEDEVPMWLLSWGDVPEDISFHILKKVYKKFPSQ